MFNNEADYPDPSSFNPERYLKNGQFDPNIRDPALMAFGFGRRQVVPRTEACLFITDFLSTKMMDQDMRREPHSYLSTLSHSCGRAFNF
jgi:hypothetical protein